MIELLIYGVGLALCFYTAWCLGANDAANPTECAVGSGAMSMKKAIILFAIFAAAGGILLGPMVMKTVDRGLVNREILSLEVLTVGSFTAVLSAGIWMTFCTSKGMPVSTSHAIIGGVLGFGLIASPTQVRWDNMIIVVSSIIASPIFAIFLAAGLYIFLRKYLSRHRAEKTNVLMIYALMVILAFAASFSVFIQILGLEVLFGLFTALIFSFGFSAFMTYIFKIKYGKFDSSRFLYILLVIGLCFSAFSFGANDMANATGVFVTPTQKLTGDPTLGTMMLLSLLGSAGIAIGAFTWGYKVLAVTAYQVTRIDTLNGAAAEYANAIVVFLFTVLPTFLFGFGMPVSTTQASVGSLIGVGIASKGLTGVSKGVTGKIIGFWILTIPAVILISMSLFWLISTLMVI